MITMTAASGLYLKLDLRTEVVQLHMLPALVALPDDSCPRMQGFIPRLTRAIRNRSASEPRSPNNQSAAGRLLTRALAPV